MASRKVNTEGIDEELLIASIGKKRSEEQMPLPVQEQSVQGQKEKSSGAMLLTIFRMTLWTSLLIYTHCRVLISLRPRYSPI